LSAKPNSIVLEYAIAQDLDHLQFILTGQPRITVCGQQFRLFTRLKNYYRVTIRGFLSSDLQNEAAMRKIINFLEPKRGAKYIFIPTFKTQSGFLGFRGDVVAFFEDCPLKTLVAEVFPSAGFRVNIQFKTMTEALEFKHSSISSANNSQNRDEHDQPEIRENDNDTMSVVTSNNRSNEAEKTPKEDVTKNVNKQKQSALIPANVLCSFVGGDNNQTSKPQQEATPPPPAPKHQRNAPKLGAKKK
jgi:hypothetical protein